LRDMDSFFNGQAIFTGTWTAPIIDGDIATILNGPGAGNEGIPWTKGLTSHYSVVVGLERKLNQECQILLRVVEGDGDVAQATFPVLLDNPLEQGEVRRLPKVSALYIDPPSATPYIEVAVVYQFWADDDTWDIGIRQMIFNPATFPADGSLSSTSDLDMPDDDGDPSIQPDIAYDPYTGDIYVVTIKEIVYGDTNVYFIHGVRTGYTNTVTMGDAVFAQDTEDESINAFNPRVACGEVGFLNYDEDWMVAFGYSAYNNEYGWHTRLNFWSVYDIENTANFSTNNDTGWDDPVYGDYAAGFPTIDIGPPGSNHAALVWIQSKSWEWSNSTVMYADTHGGDISYTALHDEPDDVGDPSWGFECSALPSVAVLKHESEDDYIAGISYLYSADYASGIWAPAYCQIITAYGGSGIEIGADNKVTFPFSIKWNGKWDSGATSEHNYGVGTALTVWGDDYWMIWSAWKADPQSETGGPTSIYGAWGDTS